MTRSRGRLGPAVAVFARQFRQRLREPRFWVIQVLVIGISIAHTLLELRRRGGLGPDLYLLPVSTYFIPAVYAALNFGFEGALPTALWCCVLSIPNVAFFHHGLDRVGVSVQLLVVLAVAVLVARRVDRETAARREAVAAQQGLEAAQRQLRTYLRMATAAQEEERKRLARELHDDTIQSLVIAKADLDAADVLPGLTSDARARLGRTQERLGQAIDGIRRFSRDLRPSLLDDLGLPDALEWLAGDVARRSGIPVAFRLRGRPRRLDSSVEVAVYRIVQEALRNVERHAGARRAAVRLALGESEVRVLVADDGQGVDTSRGDGAASGLGLQGMRERAALSGGTLAIQSRPGGGTCVRLRVPAGPVQSGRPP